MINALIASGRFQNVTEILEEGLRLVEDQEALNAEKLARLREAVAVGLEDFEEGRYRRFECPEELERYLDELAQRVLGTAVK
jgi:antitoxin ParD1/3/4